MHGDGGGRGDELRCQAEARLEEQAAGRDAPDPEDLPNLVHELQVHQIELEMQNEELRRQVSKYERISRTLRESEERFRRLLEELPIGISYSSPDGELLYHNAHARQMLGYSERELASLRAQDLYIRSADREKLVGNLKEKGEHAYEHPVRRKDGRVIWVRGKTRAIRDDSGSILYRGFAEDVTEERREKIEAQVLQNVRGAVWRMRRTEEFGDVLQAVQKGLKQTGLPFRACGLNVVKELPGISSESTYRLDEQGRQVDTDPEIGRKTIAAIWHGNAVAYRRDLWQEDVYRERENIERIYGQSVKDPDELLRVFSGVGPEHV